MASDLISMSPVKIKTEYILKQEPLEKIISAAINNEGIVSIGNISGRRIFFDLSETYWYDLGAILWLIALLHKLKIQGNELQISFPEPKDTKSEKLWDFLIRWEFFRALSKCVDEPINLLSAEQLSLTNRKSQYSRSVGLGEDGRETLLHTMNLLEMSTIIIRKQGKQETSEGFNAFDNLNSKILKGALSNLCGWDPDISMRFINNVIREGISNSILHAEGTFVNYAMRLDKKYLTLAISDNGVGIPHIIRTSLLKKDQNRERSDAELIKYFADPQMILDSKIIAYSTQKGTTTQAENAGTGLYYLKSFILKQEGELRIRSGRACVDFTSSDVEGVSEDDLLDSPGTLLRIRTPFKNVHM